MADTSRGPRSSAPASRTRVEPTRSWASGLLAGADATLTRPGPAEVRLRLLSVAPLTADEAVTRMCDAAAAGRGYVVVNPNLAHLSLLKRDKAHRREYARADLAIPDGWPVVRMMRLHGAQRAQRLVGTDMLPLLCAEAQRRGQSVGFVGGAGDAARVAAQRTRERYPDLDVSFTDPAPPGFDRDEESLRRWIEQLPARWADIVFVGLGEPRQTRVALRMRDDPRARVLFCCGKAVEFVAGMAPRAPEFWVRYGLEWAWRAGTEPRRLAPRYVQSALDLPGFVARELRHGRRNRHGGARA